MHIEDEMFREAPAPKKRRKSKSRDSEASVLADCKKLLDSLPGVVMWERRNTGAVEFGDGSFMSFGHKGRADLWCLVRCVCGAEGWHDGEETRDHVEIECKRRDGKGRLSEDQTKFKEDCEAAGVPYFVVCSAEELLYKLRFQYPTIDRKTT